MKSFDYDVKMIFLDHKLKGNKQSESRKWVSQLVNDKYIERGTSLIKISNKSLVGIIKILHYITFTLNITKESESSELVSEYQIDIKRSFSLIKFHVSIVGFFKRYHIKGM